MITNQLVWDHRGRTQAGKEGPVELRITYDRKPYYINTGIKVRGRELRDGHIVGRGDAAILQQRLEDIVAKMLRGVNKCIEEGRQIDVAEIKRQAYHVEQTDATARTAMLEWLKEQIPLLPIGAGTRRRYDVLIGRMEQYGRLTAWADLTVENLYKWDAWLHGIEKAQSNGDRQAGAEPVKIGDAAVYNYHRTLRALLTRAVKVGIIERNPYEMVRGEFRKGAKENTEYLTQEEMDAVLSLRPMAGTQMAMARDLFIFQLFTGLSYADAQAFDIKNYRKVDGKWVSIGSRIKTGVNFVSRLLPQAVEVLERYNMQVPKIGNAQYNESLKVIQRALGIGTRMHSHLARHSFATMALRMGAKIENVARILGHTSTRQTEHYAKVVAQSVHDDMDMIERKLGK